ncbi:MAG: lipopolysaccharide biosynthesis protein [Planctomycetota bacterium]|jgi:O-antigen/teichoic acid export membrane protein
MINKAKKFIREIRPHTTNIFWSNLNQVVVTILALAASVVFANLTTKELYGQYIYVLAMFGLFSIISIPGVNTVILRTVAQGREGVYRKAAIFSFLWSLLGIPLLIITGVFFYFFKTKIVGVSLIASALLFPFMTSLRCWMSFLKGRSDFRKLTIYNSIKLLTSMLAVVLSIVFTGRLIVILAAYFLVNSGFNILYHLRFLSCLRNNELDAGWKRQSYALTLMSLSATVFNRVDVILLKAFLPFSQVAVYGLVMKFADIFFQTMKSTIEAVVPNLYKSKEITVSYFYKFFLLSFLVPVILYPLVKYPILFLYKQKYSEVVGFSQVYLMVIPFYFLTSITTIFMVKYQLNKEINFSRILSMIILIVLYAVLIPLYGIWGGVVSSMLYYVVQLIINLSILTMRKTKYNPHPA